MPAQASCKVGGEVDPTEVERKFLKKLLESPLHMLIYAEKRRQARRMILQLQNHTTRGSWWKLSKLEKFSHHSFLISTNFEPS